MDYGITRLVIGQTPFIAITKDEYFAIKDAKRFISEASFLEQKIDLVMENFFELEMTLVSKAAQDMVFSNFKYSKMQNDVNDINRRIVNVLTACRMYSDQYVHHLKVIYGKNSEIIDTVRTQEKYEYDSNLSYRVVCALRNYVQHRGFPVQSVSFDSQRESRDVNSKYIVFTVVPLLDVKELQEDRSFKRSVITELAQVGKKIDLRPMLRDYITSICRIHTKVRELTKSDANQWEQAIRDCINKFKKESNTDDIVGLGIASRDKEGLYPEMINIFTDSIDHMRELQEKNSFGFSLTNLYVSNKA